jgi:hypothetical protein
VRGCDACTARHTVYYLFDQETEVIDLREHKWYPHLQAFDWVRIRVREHEWYPHLQAFDWVRIRVREHEWYPHLQAFDWSRSDPSN